MQDMQVMSPEAWAGIHKHFPQQPRQDVTELGKNDIADNGSCETNVAITTNLGVDDHAVDLDNSEHVDNVSCEGQETGTAKLGVDNDAAPLDTNEVADNGSCEDIGADATTAGNDNESVPLVSSDIAENSSCAGNSTLGTTTAGVDNEGAHVATNEMIGSDPCRVEESAISPEGVSASDPQVGETEGKDQNEDDAVNDGKGIAEKTFEDEAWHQDAWGNDGWSWEGASWGEQWLTTEEQTEDTQAATMTQDPGRGVVFAQTESEELVRLLREDMMKSYRQQLKALDALKNQEDLSAKDLSISEKASEELNLFLATLPELEELSQNCLPESWALADVALEADVVAGAVGSTAEAPPQADAADDSNPWESITEEVILDIRVEESQNTDGWGADSWDAGAWGSQAWEASSSSTAQGRSWQKNGDAWSAGGSGGGRGNQWGGGGGRNEATWSARGEEWGGSAGAGGGGGRGGKEQWGWNDSSWKSGGTQKWQEEKPKKWKEEDWESAEWSRDTWKEDREHQKERQKWKVETKTSGPSAASKAGWGNDDSSWRETTQSWSEAAGDESSWADSAGWKEEPRSIGKWKDEPRDEPTSIDTWKDSKSWKENEWQAGGGADTSWGNSWEANGSEGATNGADAPEGLWRNWKGNTSPGPAPGAWGPWSAQSEASPQGRRAEASALLGGAQMVPGSWDNYKATTAASPWEQPSRAPPSATSPWEQPSRAPPAATSPWQQQSRAPPAVASPWEQPSRAPPAEDDYNPWEDMASAAPQAPAPAPAPPAAPMPAAVAAPAPCSADSGAQAGVAPAMHPQFGHMAQYPCGVPPPHGAAGQLGALPPYDLSYNPYGPSQIQTPPGLVGVDLLAWQQSVHLAAAQMATSMAVNGVPADRMYEVPTSQPQGHAMARGPHLPSSAEPVGAHQVGMARQPKSTRAPEQLNQQARGADGVGEYAVLPQDEWHSTQGSDPWARSQQGKAAAGRPKDKEFWQ